MISFEVFARPAILTLLGKTKFMRPYVEATLQDRAENYAGRLNLIRVHVERVAGGEYVARTTGEQGSGILSSVTRANGLLAMPPDDTLCQTGGEGAGADVGLGGGIGIGSWRLETAGGRRR